MRTDNDRIAWLSFGAADVDHIVVAAGEALEAFPWVTACWLHGSLIRGQRARDLDLAVLVARPHVTLAEWDAARGAIASAVGVTPEVIDIRPVDTSSPVFLHNMLRDGRLCVERDRQARIDFEVRAHSLWCDFAPVWHRTRAEALRRWRHE